MTTDLLHVLNHQAQVSHDCHVLAQLYKTTDQGEVKRTQDDDHEISKAQEARGCGGVVAQGGWSRLRVYGSQMSVFPEVHAGLLSSSTGRYSVRRIMAFSRGARWI